MAIIKVDYGDINTGIQAQTGTVDLSTINTEKTVTFDFVPDVVIFYGLNNSTTNAMLYDSSISTTQFIDYHTTGHTLRNFGGGSQDTIVSKSSDGKTFVVKSVSSSVGVGIFQYIGYKKS